MDAVDRLRLTDAVTVSRVPIAIASLALRRHPALVAGLFVLGVVTDVVDGPLARRLGTCSERGARLDSAADAVFVAAATVHIAATVDPASRSLVGRAVATVAVTRLASLLVTRYRFGTWSVMHTHLNKATGIALAMVGTVALLRGKMSIAALGAAGVLAEVAAVEELVIVAGAASYDADHTSLLDR